MKQILFQLKNKNLLNVDEIEILMENFGKHRNLITNWAKKNLGQQVPKKYSPEIRQFALSLHFFSSKAYEYVRKEFNTILPHSRTLCKWYSHVNASPGFTEEALKTLTIKTKNSKHPIYCALLMDEMAIRQHLEYDGETYHGRVDLGNGLSSDSLEVAKECFVFMLVGVNEHWKLPIGYFLVSKLNSSQKVELVCHALDLIHDTGVRVISLTFDGCSSNCTMAQALGINYNMDNLITTYVFQKNNIDIPVEIILDPAHMIKLVRNAFAEKQQFLDYDDNIIDFNFIKELFLLQENECCHLANKIRKQHIFFFKNKMKVKLATQLLSQSVADALKFCQYNLNLNQFSKSDGTVKFIELFNNAFDICNSRSLKCIGNKKALCKDNFKEISDFTSKFTKYVQGLKVKENMKFIPVLESKRKTGFIGFILCLHSLLKLYSRLVEPGYLNHIPVYRLSQDHIELFFGSVRAMGGHNNNPTARQFRSAYKKLVIRQNNIGHFNTGNCIPLDHIDILHYSSSDPIKVINNSSNNNYDNIVDSEENSIIHNNFVSDHDYITCQNNYIYSDFSKEVIIYIAGFVAHKLTSVLRCEPCLIALCAVNKEDFLNSLITLKQKGGNKGGLSYPSADVISICFHTEKILKSYDYQNKAINKLFIQSKVLTHFINNSRIFESLKYHSSESNSPLSDHVVLLIKSITLTYVNLKIKFSLKSHNETPSLRMWYNKLTLFKGHIHIKSGALKCWF